MKTLRQNRPLSATGASGGSVLILALWTLFFLAALAIAVGTRVSSGIDLARRVQDDTTASYLARAGVEAVILAAAADTNAWDGLDTPWLNDEKAYKDAPLGGGSFSISYEMDGPQGKRQVYYGVIGEESKINLNRASRELLKAFLETAGGLDAMAAAELAAALCDWRDVDHDPGLTGGAENSYYETLDRSYQCHNGEFESVREALLVKGMGYGLFLRLEPYMTVYGTGKVNINTAGAVVMKSVAYSCGGQNPVTCESFVAKLMAFRSAGGVFREPAFGTMAGQLGGGTGLRGEEASLFEKIMGVGTHRSTCFGGTAYGNVKGHETAQSRIDFVFDRERMSKLYWHER